MQKSGFPRMHHYVGFLQIGSHVVTDVDCDFGRYFNTFIMFPNVSMTYPIVLTVFQLWNYIAIDMVFVLKYLWPVVAKNFVCLTKQSK